MAGIFNGCMIFMLIAMGKKKLMDKDALVEGSRLGYAKAGPTFGVDGFNATKTLSWMMKEMKMVCLSTGIS